MFETRVGLRRRPLCISRIVCLASRSLALQGQRSLERTDSVRVAARADYIEVAVCCHHSVLGTNYSASNIISSRYFHGHFGGSFMYVCNTITKYSRLRCVFSCKIYVQRRCHPLQWPQQLHLAKHGYPPSLRTRRPIEKDKFLELLEAFRVQIQHDPASAHQLFNYVVEHTAYKARYGDLKKCGKVPGLRRQAQLIRAHEAQDAQAGGVGGL